MGKKYVDRVLLMYPYTGVCCAAIWVRVESAGGGLTGKDFGYINP